MRRSAVVVGREEELTRLRRALSEAVAGTPGCVFLDGEAGVGKTRLLAELTAEGHRMGLAVLAGRAPVTAPVPFCVVAEALRSWLRTSPVDTKALSEFAAGVALLLPEWPGGNSRFGLSEAQLRLLALEGVVRLVRQITQAGRGVLLVADDLHAADPDSLEALRYLATARVEGLLLVGALRSREASLPEQLMRSLHRDGIAQVLELDPLHRREVSELLGALLDAQPPVELVADVMARTDGVPLLVEEVLAAHLRAGSVHVSERGTHWRVRTTVVSRTVCDLVDTRLERLSAPQRHVITVGAVLGDFDTSLLAAVARQPLETVGDAVSGGVSAGVLEPIAGVVGFRHAVLRDAVLEATLPHVLATIHGRAAVALAESSALLQDASVFARRAHHLTQIGEGDGAAELLVTAARMTAEQHSLLGAEALARTACGVARSPQARMAASHLLAGVLAKQGRWAEALELDQATDREHADSPERTQRMAACAVEAGRRPMATALIDRVLDSGDGSLLMRVLAGRLALVAGDSDSALAAAEQALTSSRAIGDADTVCAALDLQAQALDFAGRRPEAALAWARQAEEAAAHGLTAAHLQALLALGKLELFDGRPPVRLREVRELAHAAGALVEQALAEEYLSIALTLQGDPQAGREVAEFGAGRCRELRLDVLPWLLLACADADCYLLGNAAEELMIEAEALGPDVEMTINVNNIRGDHALRAGRYEEAVRFMLASAEAVRTAPGSTPADSPIMLSVALLAAGRREEAARALEQAQAIPDLARWHARPVLLAAAEALLRGDATALDAAIASATGRMPFDVALLRVLAAEILGGPDELRWLREALDLYETGMADASAARVRRLLRKAGGAVPRHRRPGPDLPETLARHGVTPREAEVLRQLGEGLANAVIAERLFLSVRTVETHVSSLLTKLHLSSRAQLTALHGALELETTKAAAIGES